MKKGTAVIGAGLSGLAAAQRRHAEGEPVDIFDKGRGPGGRMSTRRETLKGIEYHFDHGAQYFTVRDPSFSLQVHDWKSRNIVAPWLDAGPNAWVGTPMMCSPLADMAERVGVRFATRIDAVRGKPGAWWLVSLEGTFGPYTRVVVAVPAEQAAILLETPAPQLAHAARFSVTQPCWTAMIAFREPVAAYPPVTRLRGPVLAWIANNGVKPGRQPEPAWVLQATAEWSRANLGTPPETVAAMMHQAWRADAPVPLPTPSMLKAHLWRYAKSSESTETFLYSADLGIGACGDWLISARVEAAWLSGYRLGEAILAQQ